jgi:hypothetical protein
MKLARCIKIKKKKDSALEEIALLQTEKANNTAVVA